MGNKSLDDLITQKVVEPARSRAETRSVSSGVPLFWPNFSYNVDRVKTISYEF
jgi:hypothetical protein